MNKNIKKIIKTISHKKTPKIIIDFIAVIIIWRGVWGFLDVYLFPNNLAISYLISILLGILIVFADGDIRELH